MTLTPLTMAQARALGTPARRAIVDHLGEAPGPVPVTALTALLGLNHNAVRKHLAQLVAAELVVEEREPRVTRGRPRLLYRLPPAAPQPPDPYERLSVLLASALRTGADPVSVGRAAASETPAPPSATSPVEALAEQFAIDGFDPEVRRRGRRAEIVLQRCPYVAAASANPEAVCQLHLGLAQGAADAVGGVQVDGLTANDPRHAGCRVAVTQTG